VALVIGFPETCQFAMIKLLLYLQLLFLICVKLRVPKHRKVYRNKGVEEHILHLKDTDDLHNIDSSPHNTGRVNKSKMICNRHVAHTETKKYTQNLGWQTNKQTKNKFYFCMIKQAIFWQSSHTMRNQLQTVS
jgi:hypothetical protein